MSKIEELQTERELILAKLLRSAHIQLNILGNSLAILLYTAHQRNVETTLNAQISFVEQIAKSLGK